MGEFGFGGVLSRITLSNHSGMTMMMSGGGGGSASSESNKLHPSCKFDL